MEAFYMSGILGSDLTPEEIRSLPAFKEIVKMHILPGEWTTGFLLDGIEIRTSLTASNVTMIRTNKGDTLFGTLCVATSEEPASEGDCPCQSPCSKIIEPDVFASNGVVHIIDNVLLPSSIAETLETTEDISTDPLDLDAASEMLMDEMMLQELVDLIDLSDLEEILNAAPEEDN